MRLLTKTTLWYLVIALLMFSIGGIITISIFRQVINRETDYELQGTLRQIRDAAAFENGIAIFDSYNYVDIREFPAGMEIKPDTILKDTLIFLRRTNRLEPFRKLISNTKIGDKFYHIEISDIFIEEGDIISVVTWIMVRLFLFLTAALLISNFLISKSLFRPFEYLLKSLDRFRLKNNEQLATYPTKTLEFRRLNDFVETMTHKAIQDYQSLKEFSENASHEMQTPIAIAKGKLELLLESSDLSEEQLVMVQAAQQSLSKISKLGQALTLLTKIENKEFSAVEAVDFSKIVRQGVNNFTELGQLQGITLDAAIEDGITLKIDSTLADILVTNLLKNALQHNVEDGWVKVRLDASKLVVTNLGLPPKLPTDQLFERFKKNNQSKGTLGLGLAIVKKICDVNELKVSYEYEEGKHTVSIIF
ncbi:MAG: HAMP domain-containing sensor histidine kinase [Saprospiraceae bacterium]